MIRYLIWDVDGTLFDTYPAITDAFGLALRDLGATASPDWIATLARQSLGHCTTVLAQECDLDPDELGGRFQVHYAAIPPAAQPPFPGVADVCAYVCSIGGANFLFTHRGQHSLLVLLAAHGMTGYFTDWVTADDGYPKKPDPAGFEALIQRHALRREEVLAIGDRDIDVLAGKAAGVRTCLFGGAATAVTADYSITDYVQLYCLLRKQSSP
jgi:phosphoglycolate phosphatase-like HAD superfamily hydrolase